MSVCDIDAIWIFCVASSTKTTVAHGFVRCLLLFIYSSVEQLTHTFTYSFLQALCILDCTRKNLHHFHFTTHVHGHWGRKLRPVVLNFRQSITWVVVNFRSCAFFACHLLTHVSTFVSVFIHNFFCWGWYNLSIGLRYMYMPACKCTICGYGW